MPTLTSTAPAAPAASPRDKTLSRNQRYSKTPAIGVLSPGDEVMVADWRVVGGKFSLQRNEGGEIVYHPAIVASANKGLVTFTVLIPGQRPRIKSADPHALPAEAVMIERKTNQLTTRLGDMIVINDDDPTNVTIDIPSLGINATKLSVALLQLQRAHQAYSALQVRFAKSKAESESE